MADIIEDFLCRHFQLAPAETTHFTPTADIVTTLQTNGLRGTSHQIALRLAAVMKKRGFEARRQKEVRGYFGVW